MLLPTGVRVVPDQHPLMFLQGNNNIHIIFSFGSFSFHFSQVETCKEWPTTLSRHNRLIRRTRLTMYVEERLWRNRRRYFAELPRAELLLLLLLLQYYHHHHHYYYYQHCYYYHCYCCYCCYYCCCCCCYYYYCCCCCCCCCCCYYYYYY